MRHWTDLIGAVQGLPRHLGQHSGGIVIAAGRLDEVVPIEPATMVDRRIVQWDKEDCADLGIIKIDLLGLGMLAALEETIPLIRRHEGIDIDLAKLPPDDPRTYAMMRRADTIGVFQIESRAQMATLPRLKPKTFYDLVVEIAIIRPGPIVGKMVHPYLNRRAGREPVVYPHESLRPILERTLGVPIFQEQLLRIAMTAAGFSGGEAEESAPCHGLQAIHRTDGTRSKNACGAECVPRVFRRKPRIRSSSHISSFALYGFPESHSASFALIAYASAYLKRHHPAAFLVGLLRAQPMGFYSPATLVKDAQRHGVEVRPDRRISFRRHVPISRPVRNRARADPRPSGSASIRSVDLSHRTAIERIADGTGARWRSKTSVTSFDESLRIATSSMPWQNSARSLESCETPRTPDASALWQVAALERDPRSLFAGRSISRPSKRLDSGPRDDASEAVPPALAEPDRGNPGRLPTRGAHDRRPSHETSAPGSLDAARHSSAQPACTKRPMVPMSASRGMRSFDSVRVRPRDSVSSRWKTKQGLSNAVLTPDFSKRFRIPLHQASLLEVAGPLQRVDGVIHVRRFEN